MSDEVRYVRLLPYNEKLGHLRRQHSVRYNGRYHKFNEPGVWVKVPLALAERLKKARQMPGIDGSPRVFDVCTEAEARQLDAQAKATRDALKAKVEPTVDTARDIGIPEEGRGDLGLDEVTAGRFSALEEVAARAAGEEPEPEPKAKPKAKKPRKSSRRKK
jgi:hypothetical protein